MVDISQEILFEYLIRMSRQPIKTIMWNLDAPF